MKTMKILSAGLLIAALFAAGMAQADSAAIRTMANIAMNMNHFPSDEDKAALKAIIDSDDASEDEADIALAMSNIEHKLTSEDAERLTDIANDSSSDDAARKLAGVLLKFNHAAGDAEKATLTALAAN